MILFATAKQTKVGRRRRRRRGRSCDSWEILAVTKTNRTLNSDSYIVKYTLPPPGLGKISHPPLCTISSSITNKIVI